MAKKAAIILWYALTAILAVSTFYTDSGIYGSTWFVAVWCVVGIALIIALSTKSMHHNVGSMMLHSALLLILTGGAITRYTGNKGTMHLGQDRESDRFIMDNGRIGTLPFTVRLDSFTIEKHPGLERPADYVSHVRIDGKPTAISVNNVYSAQGFRIYQSSYTGNNDSILSINHDPWGTTVSYAGYILMIAGWIAVMCRRRGRFRKLMRGFATTALIMAPIWHTSAANSSLLIPAPSDQVLYQGRVAPFHTPASELVRKVTGSTRFGNQSAEHTAASIISQPDKWKHIPIIYVKDKELRKRLGMQGSHISIDSLFTADGRYKPEILYSGTDNGIDRAILELDATVALIAQAQSGLLVQPLPDGMERLPEWRVQAEIIYNDFAWSKIFFMVMLPIALASLMLTAWGGRLATLLFNSLIIIAIAASAWQLCGYILRWIIASRIPLGNGGETLQFLSLLLAATGCCVCSLSRQRALGSITLLMSGFCGLVGWLAMRDPAITPLLPVLNSPWLAIHVSLVMTAYAMLTFAALTACMALLRPSERYHSLILIVLYPALALLSAGIFSGAVWANESWGRYWAWDPKETWALITLMVYVIPLHRSAGPLHRYGPIFFIYIAISFLTVIMTYYGVNYLPSLHAYQ